MDYRLITLSSGDQLPGEVQEVLNSVSASALHDIVTQKIYVRSVRLDKKDRARHALRYAYVTVNSRNQ